MSFKKDLILLLKPYYWVNILLSLSHFIAKRGPFVCNFFFKSKDDKCELDSRETEIYFFLLIVIMIRTRKTGSVTMINYLTSSFIYTKVANAILWGYNDVKYGIAFGVVFVLVGLLLPEPTYCGPERITYFRSCQSLEDELARDKRVTWVIAFYTVWNPACVNFAPIFSKISNDYHLENMRFGKLDIGRNPDASQRFRVSDSSLSRQLPSVILFKAGKETIRRPAFDGKGKLQKFFFSEDNLKVGMDLNNVFKECRENPITKKPITDKKRD